MARVQLDDVRTPTDGVNHVYWYTDTGKVYVGEEYAGTASTREQAMIEANYYATTKKPRS